jgi:uncharacterized membrane protein YeiH
VLALDALLRWLDVAGVAVFAISGALVAARKRLDVVGFMVVGVLTGFGGGTLRDLLLGRTPIFWLQRPELIAAAALAALAVFMLRPRLNGGFAALLWADALGMALYAVLGAEIALLSGAQAWAAVLLGVVTASFGGVLRDIVCDELPLLLQREIYALAALAGASVFVGLRLEGVWRDTALLCGMTVGFAIRGAAIRFGWSLPTYRPRD